MALHDDLLDQAQQLATLDSRRPRQVNLRCSVSRSYYALFHLLTSAAGGMFGRDEELLARLVRVYNHGEMRRVAATFYGQQLPRSLRSDEAYVAPEDLRIVARAFFELQDARHAADYDLTRDFTRAQALTFVQRVRDAFAAWGRIRNTDAGRLFLGSFLLWRRWDEEPR